MNSVQYFHILSVSKINSIMFRVNINKRPLFKYRYLLLLFEQLEIRAFNQLNVSFCLLNKTFTSYLVEEINKASKSVPDLYTNKQSFSKWKRYSVQDSTSSCWSKASQRMAFSIFHLKRPLVEEAWSPDANKEVVYEFHASRHQRRLVSVRGQSRHAPAD